MKPIQKSKLSSIIIIILCIIAIILMLLKITGTFDITTLFGNSSSDPNKTDGSGGYFIDEWVSEPFGELDVTLSVTSYDNGLIRLLLHSDSENFDSGDFRPFYKDTNEDGIGISDVHYDRNKLNGVSPFRRFGYDKETGLFYTGFAVPMDCEKILINGKEFIPQSASLKTTAGEVEFKIFTFVYYDPESFAETEWDYVNSDYDSEYYLNYYSDYLCDELILIDKEGNQHLIKED